MFFEIVVDDRERAFHDKCLEHPLIIENKIKLIKQKLDIGDILLQKRTMDLLQQQQQQVEILCIIERKSFTDLLQSIKDGRYEEQSFRLLNASHIHSHNIVYLIEGSREDIKMRLNQEEQKRYYSSMASLLFFKGFSVLKTYHLHDSVETIVNFAEKMQREIFKNKKTLAFHLSKNEEKEKKEEQKEQQDQEEQAATIQYVDVIKKCKKDNITKENFGEIVISQIPGVGAASAKAIMKEFTNFAAFLTAIQSDPLLIERICLETTSAGQADKKKRKISKSVANKILNFLL